MTPGHAKPAVAPEWRQRVARSQRRILKQAGRRLAWSPWFAAGAGVVIATGVMIYTPHANLNFGKAIQVTPCTQASCPQTAPAQAPGLPAGSGVTASPSTPSLPAGMTFSYQVLSQSTQYGFIMLITIHSPHNFGLWHLSLVIPGTRDLFVVYGARWRSSGADSGTASSSLAGTESAGYAMISAHENGGEGGSSQNGYTVLIQIHGSGTAGQPIHCTYNGAHCTFKPSTSLAPASSQGAG